MIHAPEKHGNDWGSFERHSLGEEGATSVRCLETTEAANHSLMHKIVPCSKNRQTKKKDLAPNVTGAQAENAWGPAGREEHRFSSVS